MTERDQDAQRRYFEEKTDEEVGQTALDDGGAARRAGGDSATDESGMARGADTRPGRAPEFGQAEEASPTGTVGQREYAAGEGSAGGDHSAG
jgi:hypothetical protein